MLSCKYTPTTGVRKPHLAESKGEQDPVQTRVCWALRGWRQDEHSQLNCDSLPIEHTYFRSHKCSYKYKQVYNLLKKWHVSIYSFVEEKGTFWAYQGYPTHVSTIQHGYEGGIAYSRLARHVQITISQSNSFYSILIRWNFIRAWMTVDFLGQSFIVLEVASTCMETYDSHEDVLVVSQVSHCLQILDVGMLVQVYHQWK